MASSNEKFMYLLLTHGGPPTIDWDAVSNDLGLAKTAATKRWSRLKQAMQNGEKPAASSENLLWLALKHSNHNKTHDWNAIAEATQSTPGAVSKRWSRLKLAFEQGSAPPATPVKAMSEPATPQKSPRKANNNNEGTPSKRKRGPNKHVADDSEDEPDVQATPKRARSTPKTKPRPKKSFRASDQRGTVKTEAVVENKLIIKGESSEDTDVFVDAPDEHNTDGVELEQICKLPMSIVL